MQRALRIPSVNRNLCGKELDAFSPFGILVHDFLSTCKKTSSVLASVSISERNTAGTKQKRQSLYQENYLQESLADISMGYAILLLHVRAEN